MCYTYDKSKGGDTRELHSRMVPPQKKLGRVTLKRNFVLWSLCSQSMISQKYQLFILKQAGEGSNITDS